MSTPSYESTGRVDQKARTRSALLAATRELIADGRTPTVDDAARAARVSRTTAYRYFPSQDALLAAAHPEIQTTSLLGDAPPSDPDERIARVVAAFTQLIQDTEPQQRAMLRLSLGHPGGKSGLLRKGRAIGWISEALRPLQGTFTDDELRRLAFAMRSAIGIESRVWLTDVAGLSPEEVTALARWTAEAIYQHALEHPPPAAAAAAKKRRPRKS